MKISYSLPRPRQHRAIATRWQKALALCAILLSVGASTARAAYYTDKQLDAFAERIGKIYWLDSRQGKPPVFLTNPLPGAASFSPPNESFEIVDLVGRGNDQPYYKVSFESGKIGYIRPEAFLEQFNLSISSADPQADEKKKAEADSKEEAKRIEWINAQPWSPAVKQAAIKKQLTAGLNTNEVKGVLGPPRRIRKLHGPLKTTEEQWFYPDGSVVIFSNGLFSRIEKSQP